MNKQDKDVITNIIRERDKLVHQYSLRLWRLGHIKRPTKPRTLIHFPTKSPSKPIPYKHNLNQSILGVFREEGNQVKTIYLAPPYTSAAFIGD
jgi:hypothetical protein